MSSTCPHPLLLLHEDAGIDEVLERGEPLPDREADEPEDHDEAEVEVSDDGPAHEPAPLVVAVDAGRDPDGGGVGPRQRLELRPPPRDHQRDVEAQDKRHRDQVREAAAVDHHLLEDQLACKRRKSQVNTVGSWMKCSIATGARLH